MYGPVALLHTRVTLVAGGITSGFGMPDDVFTKLVIEMYAFVLLRSTQKLPSDGVPDGRVSELSPVFVKL